MKKSVLFVADIDKCGVQSRHQLLDLGQIEVAHGIRYVAALLLKRHQTRILEKRYRHFLAAYIYY